MFPFVAFSRANAVADASALQAGDDSQNWVNIPFDSPNGTELIYVRMTREQFARFGRVGTAVVELISANHESQRVYLQIADATASKLETGSKLGNGSLEPSIQSDPPEGSRRRKGKRGDRLSWRATGNGRAGGDGSAGFDGKAAEGPIRSGCAARQLAGARLGRHRDGPSSCSPVSVVRRPTLTSLHASLL